MIKLHSILLRTAMGVFTLSVLLGSMASAVDATPFWPQFHGPDRDNKSTETNFLKSWPEGGPALEWTAEGLGYGYSTVAIANGLVYTAGNIEGETVITALDLNGEIQWQAKNGEGWTTKSAYPGTRGTPTIDGDHVYHENPHGNVVCLDAKNGDLVWEVNVLKKYNAPNIRWALSESVLVDEKNVYVSPGGPEVSMVALNKRTGDVVWTSESTNEASGYSSPTLFEHRGLRIVTVLTAKSLIGVNADTGKLLWHVDHESYTDQNTLMPIFHEGHLFVSTIRGGSAKWRVNVDGDDVVLEEIWRNENFDNQHGGAVLTGGKVYGSSVTKNRGKWICLDWETGEITHMGTPVGRGSITYADGLLYMLTAQSEMGLVKPLESGYDVISIFPIPEGGEGASWAHPVVTGGRLYIRHGVFLYAYDISASN